MVIRVKHIVYLVILILIVRHFNPLESIAIQKYNVEVKQSVVSPTAVEVHRYSDVVESKQIKAGNFSYSQSNLTAVSNENTSGLNNSKDVVIGTAVETATKGFCILEYLFFMDNLRDERKHRKNH